MICFIMYTGTRDTGTQAWGKPFWHFDFGLRGLWPTAYSLHLTFNLHANSTNDGRDAKSEDCAKYWPKAKCTPSSKANANATTQHAATNLQATGQQMPRSNNADNAHMIWICIESNAQRSTLIPSWLYNDANCSAQLSPSIFYWNFGLAHAVHFTPIPNTKAPSSKPQA